MSTTGGSNRAPGADRTQQQQQQQQQQLPPGTTTSTWPIWVMALLPLVGIVVVLVEDPGAEFRRIIARSVQQMHDAQNGVLVATNPFDGYMALSIGSSIVLILLQIGLAIADERALRRLGVIRPFPWAWVLLNPTYIIGRHVVVRRRARGSLAPLWVWIGAEVVDLVVVGTILATAIGSAVSSFTMR